MTPTTTAAATARELREWAKALRKHGAGEELISMMRKAADVIDDLARRVAVLEGEGCCE